MLCPYCRKGVTTVIENRKNADGTVIRRRRQCPVCGRRITTHERYKCEKHEGRVYISGPITGVRNYLKRFQEAEDLLTRNGFNIVNPAKNGAVAPDATHEEYMHICLAQLDICDTICMLPGWETSKGAVMEYRYAKEHGKKVVKMKAAGLSKEGENDK